MTGFRGGVSFLLAVSAWAQQPNVEEIIQKSVAANQADFQAAPDYNHEERDRNENGSKTFEVMMIGGSPYRKLIAIDGKPLSAAQNAQEEQKLKQAEQQRRSESSQARQQRIAKYQQGRVRNNAMMEQLTKAFEFTLLGQRNVNGFDVWVLKATPKPGYQPPNMQTQVLPGMQGELWIDQKTYQWVKVTARVIHPVSIEGFLAQVEPGTQFELEKMPVGDGVWMASHFAMKANAKVLFLFTRASQEDDTFFNYKK